MLNKQIKTEFIFRKVKLFILNYLPKLLAILLWINSILKILGILYFYIVEYSSYPYPILKIEYQSLTWLIFKILIWIGFGFWLWKSGKSLIKKVYTKVTNKLHKIRSAKIDKTGFSFIRSFKLLVIGLGFLLAFQFTCWYLHNFFYELKRSWVVMNKDYRTCHRPSIFESTVSYFKCKKLRIEQLEQQANTRISAITPTPTPTPTPELIDKMAKADKSGLSPGIFFPSKDGIIINNPSPTIIVKLFTNGNTEKGKLVEFLPSRVLEKESVVSGEKRLVKEYLPGKIQRLKVELDGRLISPLFGITQWPEEECQVKTDNPDKCIYPASDPDVLVFAKPDWPLAQGKHTLHVYSDIESNASWSGDFGTMSFFVYSNYDYGDQLIPDGNKVYYDDMAKSFISNDNCARGYYYDTSVLKVPLPESKNDLIIYQPSFAKTPDSTPSASTIAQIGFGEYRYNLFFPNSDNFNGFTYEKFYINDYEQLFLPINNLYYQSGEKVSDVLERNWGKRAFTKFHMIIRDYTGGIYLPSLPWITSDSSGCDG